MFSFRKQSHTSLSDVYASCISSYMKGYPLWFPEPHDTGEPQIGDVGYLADGAFVRLFNINVSDTSHHVTRWKRSFAVAEPLDPTAFDADPRKVLLPGTYRSNGTAERDIGALLSLDAGTVVPASAGIGADYKFNVDLGAVLVLGSPGWSEVAYARSPLKKYMLRHYDSWTTYVNDTLGHDIKKEELSLIIGSVKTSADWTLAAFSNVHTKTSMSLEVQAANVASAKGHVSQGKSVTGLRMRREGDLYHKTPLEATSSKRGPSSSAIPAASAATSTSPTTAPTTDGANQCISLIRLKVRKQLGILRKIVAGAGYHQLPGRDGRKDAAGGDGAAADEDSDVEEDTWLDAKSESAIADPLDILLEYILAVSGAEIAVASDIDIENIVCGNHVVDLATYLGRVKPPVEVEGTVGSVSVRGMISRDQERVVARRAIAPADVYRWPGLSFHDAAILETGKVFVGSTDADTLSLKWKHFVFKDSGSSSRRPGSSSGDCKCLALSPDGTLLAASFQTNTVVVWRLSDGLLVQRLRGQGYKDWILSVAFSPNTHHLVSGSRGNTAIVWDFKHGLALLRLEGHRAWVWTVAYSPDGSRIATGSSDRSVKIWDASSGECLHSLDLGERVNKIIFSQDGARIVVQLLDTGAICDARTGTRVATLRLEGGKMMGLSLSSQGDRALASTNDGKVKIWSAVTGEELLELNEHEGPIASVALSPDGAEIASASDDCTVVACDSWTGQRRHLYRMSLAAHSVAYSPNGNYIAMGDLDGRIRVCDARSGVFLTEFLVEFDGPMKAVYELQFLADGNHLLARSKGDGAVRLWSVQDVIRLH